MKNKIPNELEVMQISLIMKVLSDASRLKILFAINGKPKSVSEIQEMVGMSQSAVSHQLAILKKANVVETKRYKNKIFYSIKNNGITKILDIFNTTLSEGYWWFCINYNLVLVFYLHC